MVCPKYSIAYDMTMAYGLDDTVLELVYSYLKDWQRCVYVNNTYINFEDIILGVPQGLINSWSNSFQLTPISDLF